jgi:hypothetical protein
VEHGNEKLEDTSSRGSGVVDASEPKAFEISPDVVHKKE